MTGRKNKNLVCVDYSSSKDEYHTLSKSTWEIYQIIQNAPEFIKFPTLYVNKELRMYANIKIVNRDDDSKFLKNEDKLDSGHWQDIRKSQSGDFGKPFKVPTGCLIRIPSICRGMKLRIYMEKNYDNTEQDPE